jgi:hypothetical protein
MASNKVLRGSVTIWLAYPEAFANPALPTATEMNNTTYVKEISCAVEDAYTMNLTDSDTDDLLSVCDTGQSQTPTSANYEVSFDLFADESPTAAGVFNRARDLVRKKGNDYYAIKRLNIAQGTAVAIGHILYIYKVKTDNMQILAERGEAVRYGARFKQQGEAYSDVVVTA